MIKPILFNTDMVRSILDNRKTVTRRVVKFLPGFNPKWTGYVPDGAVLYGSKNIPAAKPPYRPGDILYVRETWRVQSARRFDADARIEFKAGGDMVRIQFPGGGDQYHSRIQYDAFVSKWADDRWHPSIHMPREAARIFLRVTDVRVERLQDINAAGALAEGCDGRCEGPQDGALSDCQKNYDFSIEKFQTVWNSTLKPADRALYGWDANPWVWVIEFERISKEEAINED